MTLTKEIRHKIKLSLFNLSILFFALSFFTTSFSTQDTTLIIKTQNENIPDYLFDISFELYKTKVGDIEQLRGHGTFENFGKETSQLDYTIILYNDKMDNIISIDRTVTVQTQEFLSFEFDEFDELKLKPGKYTVVLSTIYDEDIKDIFVQDFYIAEFYNPSIQISTFVFFTVLIFVILFFIIFEVKTGRGKKSKKLVLKEFLIKHNNKRKRLK